MSATASHAELDWSVLELDWPTETARIEEGIRAATRKLRRRGLIVAISGGIDSAVCAALAVRALGAPRVLCLILPERDSAAESAERGRLLAEHLQVSVEPFDIAPTLEAIGCYGWRDDAIRRVLPEYDSRWKIKIAITGGMDGQVNRFKLVAQSPAGEMRECMLGLREYLQVVSATSFKQRIRKTIEYFHADRLNYAVVGTPNRLEYDQGFFVKNGDGSADLKPIAHLYKSQVYALAEYLNVPRVIRDSTPSTDTYSLPQGQDEFYFALPYREMDLALWAFNHQIPAAVLATRLGISELQAERVYTDIRNKRQVAAYLHQAPLVLEEGLRRYSASASSPADSSG